MTVFVFSGTSEGRQLVEELNKNGISCHVFVATEYGQEVMSDHPLCQVHVGRLGVTEITSVLQDIKPRFVFDATHPHAVEVSVNIKSACLNASMPDAYIRVSRHIEKVDINKEGTSSEDHTVEACAVGTMQNGEDYYNNESPYRMTVVSNYQAAIKRLLEIFSEEDTSYNKPADSMPDIINNTPQGTVLLTTGVKELSIFSEVSEIKDRLVVRILPGIDSLEIAKKCGILPKHIVAMEGPFGVELNLALIRHFNSKVLVTKNSGSRGGFYEKVEAAKMAGIEVIVVESQASEIGISIEAAIQTCISASDV